MTAKEHESDSVPGRVPAGSEARGEGDAQGAPFPGPSGASAEELTVDDILNAQQTEAAGAAEGFDDEAVVAVDEAHDDPQNEYLDDLRRVTAEYANYRKRTEANAVIEKQRATAAAVSSLLPVLDDLDRAEAHGDLEEGSAFATIAQKIRVSLERMGLESFGEKGEVFDPQMHEAIAQVPVPGTVEHTVLDVVERGYRIGDVELRPAKVAVAVGADG